MDSYSISFKAALVGGQARTLQLSCITVSLEGGEGTGPIHSYLAVRSLGQLGLWLRPSAFVRPGLHVKLWPL